jgi:hypothetical protein
MAFVVAFAATLVGARSGRRALTIAAVGPVLSLVWLALLFAGAPERPYHDEELTFGLWIDRVVFLVLGLNLGGWIAGSAAGYATRRPTGARSRPSPEAR